ncbi:MAG: T9SS type A sorting domain-containing protein [Flavobacteriales bacterium]|nr:T9SS type A sorting domain-containing protein [Flavobacteriales bacterium]
MKRIFTLFVISFVTISLLAQINPSEVFSNQFFIKPLSTDNSVDINIKANYYMLGSTKGILEILDAKQELFSAEYISYTNDDFKEEYSYNLFGKVTEYTSYSREVDTWTGIDKFLFIYDSYGKLLEITVHHFDFSSFNPLAKFTFTYDVTNNLVERLFYYWDGSNFLLSSKNSFSYDSSKNILEEIEYSRRGSSWAFSRRIVYSYDGLNNLSDEIHYKYQLNEWGYISKNVYTYDTFNNLTEDNYYTWDGLWEISYRTIYSFDDSNLTEYIMYNCDGSSCTPAKRYSYIYDNYDRKIEMLESTWNLEWVNVAKRTVSFDGAGNVESFYSFVWENESWLNSTRRVSYTYNNDYAFSDLVLPQFSEFESYSSSVFNHLLLGYKQESWVVNSWEDYYEAKFTFVDHNLGLSVDNKLGLKIYPNPTSSYINFEFDNINKPTTFDLFDINSRLIISKTIENSTKVNLSNFDRGVYFYRIYNSSISHGGKIILK